jgi:probable HAF family extracellular repeat protein
MKMKIHGTNKSRRLAKLIAVTLFAALAMPVSLAAQEQKEQKTGHRHYQLVDVGTFGGPNSSYVIGPPVSRLLNNSGVAVGGADTSTPDPSCIKFNFDCFLSYGFKWRDGVAHKLGALPGFNSSFALWVSDNGLVAGISENGIDPLTGGPALEAILWGEDGSINDLGTLGGNQSGANFVNNSGQVAGAALNAIPDLYAGFFFLPGATQVHAFLWTNSKGMQDLGTLGGTDSSALFINERGQIAGWSFTNTTPNSAMTACGFSVANVPTEDPFIWMNGKMTDLGTLGGTCGQANDLNNRGQVAGFSDLAEDSTEHPFLWSEGEGMKDLGTLGGTFGHADSLNDAGEVVGTATTTGDLFGRAFLWRNGVMTNLGTLGTDPDSEAFSVNLQGQVVGGTGIFNVVDHSAFLWEHGGPMVDLNTLVPPNPNLQLTLALYINDRGEIAALGTFSSGDRHAFVLIPCDENHAGVEGCDFDTVDAETAAQERPAQITAASAAASFAKLTPAERMTRFRSMMANRNRRFGATPPK